MLEKRYCTEWINNLSLFPKYIARSLYLSITGSCRNAIMLQMFPNAKRSEMQKG